MSVAYQSIANLSCHALFVRLFFLTEVHNVCILYVYVGYVTHFSTPRASLPLPRYNFMASRSPVSPFQSSCSFLSRCNQRFGVSVFLRSSRAQLSSDECALLFLIQTHSHQIGSRCVSSLFLSLPLSDTARAIT